MNPKRKTKTFADQAAEYLVQSQSRQKHPIRPNTVKTYEKALRINILPILGVFPLQHVGNKEVKEFVQLLHSQKVAPASIALNITIIKQILASAIDENGESLYPRKWNSSFIDSPAIESQKQPTTTPETLQEALRQTKPGTGALIAILAGTGLRISEALALTIRSGSDDGTMSAWIPEESKLVVRLQRVGTAFGPVKTKAGVREVDLAPELNDYLKKNLTSVEEYGMLFPLSEKTYRDQFHALGITTGFHSLRRFRVTHLQKMNVPLSLIEFWTGHAAVGITGRYTKVGNEIETRKTEAARVGLGFKLETT